MNNKILPNLNNPKGGVDSSFSGPLHKDIYINFVLQLSKEVYLFNRLYILLSNEM